MQCATEKDLVIVSYEGFLASGEKFEFSEENAPLAFQFGNNNLMPGFEKAVLGMTINETKTITIPAKEAFGPRQDDLAMTINRTSFGDQPLNQGMVVSMNMEKDGKPQQLPATIIKVDDDQVTVDFNHPLAGQELTYKITLMDIKQPLAPKDDGCGCSSASCNPTSGCGNA